MGLTLSLPSILSSPLNLFWNYSHHTHTIHPTSDEALLKESTYMMVNSDACAYLCIRYRGTALQKLACAHHPLKSLPRTQIPPSLSPSPIHSSLWMYLATLLSMHEEVIVHIAISSHVWMCLRDTIDPEVGFEYIQKVNWLGSSFKLRNWYGAVTSYDHWYRKLYVAS